MSLWLWLLVPLIGLVLGLFGAGGGMLTVPILMYGAALPIKQAIAVSLWIVAAVSLIAATQQRAWRVLQPNLLFFFALGGIGGSVLGAWTGIWIMPFVQQLLFGILLLTVSWWLTHVRLSQYGERQPCRCGLAILAGAGLGMVTGLLGVGGGFLMVPTLIALGVSYLPTAVAHSLVLIAINATISAVTYAHTVELPATLMVAIVLIAAAGSLVGGRLLYRLPVHRMQSFLSLALAVIGLGMLAQLAVSLW